MENVQKAASKNRVVLYQQQLKSGSFMCKDGDDTRKSVTLNLGRADPADSSSMSHIHSSLE